MRTGLSSCRWGLMGVGACALLLLSLAQPALADGKRDRDPKVLSPHSTPFGMTYGEWGAAWQQWVFTTTTENCPVTDTTGERALVNQYGDVYFLAGTFGELPGTPWAAPNPVTRTVTIPEGITLCMPINNWGLIYPDDLPFTEAPPGASPEEAMPYFYKALNAAYDNTPESDLLCEVDGVGVKNLRNYRAQSEPFLVFSPADNVQSDLMYYFMGTPFYATGMYLSVSDGYYVMLAPLSVGKHKIHLRAGGSVAPLFCDVYYDLTVAPKTYTKNCGVVPLCSKVQGKSYEDWSAKWWQWALALPNSVNPIEDLDGSFQAQGQSGKVWFLAGTSGFEAERTVRVPRDKAIFFPIVNNIWVTLPDMGDSPFSMAGAEQAARAAINTVADTLECEVDGKALKNTADYRVKSPVFDAYLPIDAWGFAPYIDHAGNYPDCVSDGYWIMLEPLSIGKHTIHFRGGNSLTPWFTEVTYHVTVK